MHKKVMCLSGITEIGSFAIQLSLTIIVPVPERYPSLAA